MPRTRRTTRKVKLECLTCGRNYRAPIEPLPILLCRECQRSPRTRLYWPTTPDALRSWHRQSDPGAIVTIFSEDTAWEYHFVHWPSSADDPQVLVWYGHAKWRPEIRDLEDVIKWFCKW